MWRETGLTYKNGKLLTKTYKVKGVNSNGKPFTKTVKGKVYTYTGYLYINGLKVYITTVNYKYNKPLLIALPLVKKLI